MASFCLFYWFNCTKGTIPGLTVYIQDDSVPSIPKLFKYIFPADRWPKNIILLDFVSIAAYTLKKRPYLIIACRENGVWICIIFSIVPLNWTRWPRVHSHLELSLHKPVVHPQLSFGNKLHSYLAGNKFTLKTFFSVTKPQLCNRNKYCCQSWYSIWTPVVCLVFRNSILSLQRQEE